MKVMIALRNNPSILNMETDIDTAQLTAALNASATEPLSLTDTNGVTYLVPLKAVAYVRIGELEQKRVGFGLA